MGLLDVPAASIASVAAKAPNLVNTAMKTAAYTAASGDLVRVDTTSGAVPITAPATTSKVQTFAVKHVAQGGINEVTVLLSGSDVFENSSTTPLRLQTQGQTVTLVGLSGVWVVQSESFSRKSLDSLYASNAGLISGRSAVLRQGSRFSYPNGATHTMWPNSTSSSSSTVNTANSVIEHVLLTGARRIRLSWTNSYGAESIAAPTTITITAGVTLPSAAIVQVTWSGATSVVLVPGATVTSDWITLPTVLAAGAAIQSRTFVTATISGGNYKWPVGFAGAQVTPSVDGGEQGANLTDKSISGSIPITGTVFLYGPCHIEVDNGPATFIPNCFVFDGDSIAYGQGDDQLVATEQRPFGRGYLARALGGTRPYVNNGYTGDTAANWLTAHTVRQLLGEGCSDSLCEYGRNDLTGGAAWTTVAASLISIWTIRLSLGSRVHQATITPISASTDHWMTTANQTTDASNAQRVLLNSWLRDGAPMVAGAPVAVGTVGASRCEVWNSVPALVSRASGSPHLLTSVFDPAGAVETTSSSGLWVTDPNIRTIAVTSIGVGNSNFNLTSGTVTSADLKKFVLIQGAGASGAALYATINFVNSSTQIGLSTTCVTAVTAASTLLGYASVSDGTHPTSYGYRLAAAAVPVTQRFDRP